MFKRFHDADKWEKSWFRKLSPSEKCAWDFISSRCDNVGVWDADTEAAEYFIGKKIDWAALPGKCNGNIKVMDNGKWWLVDFCRFQFPVLEDGTTSRPLLSYIALLKKHGLWELYLNPSKGLDNGMNTVQDKEKDKDKDKDIILILGEQKNVKILQRHYDSLVADLGEPIVKKWVEELSIALATHPKYKYARHDLVIRKWYKKDLAEHPPKAPIPSRPDAWTPEKQAAFGRELDEAKPATDEELAEVRRLAEANKDTPGGKLVSALLRGSLDNGG
jgi:hypothetical protein